MIRVRRPGDPPKVLGERAGKAAEAHRRAYNAGGRAFDFDAGIYGHKSVKNALKRAQHGKCAFCEAKITHVAHGDVEHFRPKAGFRQTGRNPLEQPGYYWLAYDWTNLLLACQLCNQRHKRNLFPLVDASRRARSHHDDAAAERPMFIDPAAEDPTPHISFHREVPYAVGGSRRGRETIDGLGLDRETLDEHRRERLGPLDALVDIVKLAEQKPELSSAAKRARIVLRRASEDSAEYAGMVRALLASRLPSIAS